MKIRNTFLTTAFVACASFASMAQAPNNANLANTISDKSKLGLKDGWSVNLNFGSMLFYGDIRQYDYYPVSKDHTERQWGYGLSVTKQLSPIFGLQAQVLNGKLSGLKRGIKIAKTGTYTEAHWFNADVFEYDVNLIFNLSNISFNGNLRPRKLNLYALLGYGLTNFRSQLWGARHTKAVGYYGYDKDGKEIFRTTEVVVPFGAGIRYRINRNFDITSEITLRNVNTDKLDAKINKNSAKDKYGYTCVGVSYKFDYKKEDEEWVSPLSAMYNDLENVKTKIEGLTNDKDKDGVADIFDKDNNTHEGIKVYGDGTSVDTDMDGVSDVDDAEPFSSKGARVDANGREIDGDNDGVPDSRDLEANTTKGSLVNFQGVTIPTATVEAAKLAGGVFDITSAGFIPSIFFELGSSKIEYKHLQNLAAIARILKTNPGVKLSIVGNTDAVGNAKNNEKLSKRRAEGVKEHLVKVYGIEDARLFTDFKGSTEPLAKDEPKGGSLFNRRVDFKISK